MKRLVIIPAYNEERKIGRVIEGIRREIPGVEILVIDDGSVDETALVASQHRGMVIRHPINRGLGGAIGTGLAFAKKFGYEAAVTFDADEQHDPKDLQPVFEILAQRKADVVIGNRMNRKNKLPTDRLIINLLANGLTFLLFGIPTHDSQSGFRGFNQRAIKFINLKTDKMEVSSEIFGEIQRLKLGVIEYPITVRYTHYSRSKGQKNSNAWSILKNLVLRLFR